MSTPMNEFAGPGEVFVCSCCGRRSRDRFGHRKIHSGWDMSCVLNARKYREQDLILAPNGTAKPREGAQPISVLN